MIELREDGSIPGPDQYGRIYKLVDPITGCIGYNMWASEFPQGDPRTVAQIEGYSSFLGFVTDVLPIEEAYTKVRALNDAPDEYMDTPHTLLVARVRRRVAEGLAGDVDGATVLQDLAEMVKDLEGGTRRAWPAVPGWKKAR